MRRMVLLFVVCGIIVAVFSTGCNRNQPPAVPQVSGPKLGSPGETLTYTFSSVDPENQEIAYMVAWGDTSAVEWSPLYASGQQVTRTHAYAELGTYHIKVKARDAELAESEWSEPLNVSVGGSSGGSPTGVALSSGPGESDSTVVIAWTAPAWGRPDKYIVCFRAVTDSGYAVIGETTGTSYAHNPYGMTGQYRVTAVFGARLYYGAEKPTTVPIHGDTVTLFEINKDSSRCAYGWTRDSGRAGFFSMTDRANAAAVDFYISNLQVGFTTPPYNVVTPNKADSAGFDPGAGMVPSADWRKNGFSDPLPDEQSPLPHQMDMPPNYFIYCQIPQVPCYVACYTAGEEEKHYALIKVTGMDEAAGWVQVETWYQLVPGLRLIRH